MSFGFSVGDFLAVGKLCWSVYKKCKDSKGTYAELTGEISALYAVIKETEELVEEQKLSERQLARLLSCQKTCDDVLQDLDALLNKYQKLGTKSQWTFDRLKYGDEDINGIRQRITMNVTMLDALNNASVSLAQVDLPESADSR